MRMAAGPEWLLLGRALGVTAVPLGMPEVYLALKTGTMDGQENPLSILNAAKFYEVTEQVVLTAHMVQPVFFALAQPVWDKLDAGAEKGAWRCGVESGEIRRRSSVCRRGGDRYCAEGPWAVGGCRRSGVVPRPGGLASMPSSDLAKAWDAAGLQRVLKA